MDEKIYLTPKQIAESPNYPFTYGQIRSYLERRDTNGLNPVVRKIGRCLYLRKDLFEKWIDAHVL